MKKEKIYVIYNLYLKTGTISAIDNVAFRDVEKAVEYIESKLTEQEILNNRKAKQRNLQSNYEFISKDYIYYWKEITLE
nr:MAG TPA: hypothetical protein [Caudoviricetes sp.]